MTKGSYFSLGGAIIPRERSVYVRRIADDELLESCQNGEYCYVLDARQMGKTSLIYNTEDRLKRRGFKTAIIDLEKIGTSFEHPGEWFYGFAYMLLQGLEVEFNLPVWWTEHANLPYTARLTELFIEILRRCPDPIVVFVDEIEITKRVSFALNFFWAIKVICNRHISTLSFILVGLSRPEDLIASSDVDFTSINPDVVVELSDFTAENIVDLIKPLNNLATGLRDEVLARWIIEFTGGHPYLTQLVCYELSKYIEPIADRRTVQNAVDAMIISSDFQQKHLKYIKRYLVEGDNIDEKTAVLCQLWLILNGEKVPDNDDPITKLLKLSGVVKNQDGLLVIRNRIYRTTFTKQWLQEELSKKGIQTTQNAQVVKSYIASMQKKTKLPSQQVRDVLSDLELNKENNTVDVSEFNDELKPEVLEKQIAALDEIFMAQRANVNESVTPDKDLASYELEHGERSYNFSHEQEVEVKNEEADVQLEAKEIHAEQKLLHSMVQIGSFKIKLVNLVVGTILAWLLIGVSFLVFVVFGSEVTFIFIGYSATALLTVGLAYMRALIDYGPETSNVGESLGVVPAWLTSRLSSKPQESLPVNGLRRISSWFSFSDWVNRFALKTVQFDKWVDEKLTGADISLRTREAYSLLFLSTLLTGWLGYYVGGQSLSSSIGLVALLFFTLYGYYIWRPITNARYVDSAMQQLLTYMISALRSGFSDLQALRITAKELGGYVGRELERIILDVQLGNHLHTSFSAFGRRVPSTSLGMLSEIMTSFRESRGNLSDALLELRTHLQSVEKIEKIVAEGRFPPFSVVFVVIFLVLFFQEKVLASNLSSLYLDPSSGVSAKVSALFVIAAVLMYSFASQLMDDISRSSRIYYGDLSIGLILCLIGYLLGFSKLSLIWMLLILFSRSKAGVVVLLALILTYQIYILPAPAFLKMADVLQQNLLVGATQTVTWLLSIIPIVQSVGLQVVISAERYLNLDFDFLFTAFWVTVASSSMLLLILALRIIQVRGRLFSRPRRSWAGSFIGEDSYDLISFRSLELSQTLISRTVAAFLKIVESVLYYDPFQQWYRKSQRRLAQAGLTWIPPTFLIVKITCACVASIVVVLHGVVHGLDITHIYYGTILGLIGFIIPELFLTRRIQWRRKNVRKELPSAIFIVKMLMSVGDSATEAIESYTAAVRGEFSSILWLYLKDLYWGVPREKALENMMTRLDSYEVRLFATALDFSARVEINREKIFQEIYIQIDKDDELAARSFISRVSWIRNIALLLLLGPGLALWAVALVGK